MSQILLREFEKHGSKTKANGAINGHRSRGKARDTRGGVSTARAVCANARAVGNHDRGKRASADKRRSGARKVWRFPGLAWFTGEARDRLLVVAIFAAPAINCGVAFMRGLIG
jgi:hypothetical protein